MSVLEMKKATMCFGGVTAVNQFDLEINENEIVAVIGPNGAGKTTAFNMVTGVYTPTSGSIRFNGKEISGRRPDQIALLGISRTFQNIRLFRDLTVLENVLVACHLRVKTPFFSAMLHLPGSRKEETFIRERSEALLKRTGLFDYRNDVSGSLPYGLQRRLEITRALATSPSLLLLDEPAAGMNPKESEDLTAFIHEIKDEFNLTILLIEHHMQLVMDISERIYVLNYGNVIAHGTPAEIQANPHVIKAYLGEVDDAQA